jgi:hypothetical protein
MSPSTDENEKQAAGAPAGSPGLSDRHKEAVKAWVPAVRQLLEGEFAGQLARLGLRPDGKHQPLEKMRLPDAAVSVRRRVEALIARDAVAEGTPRRGYDNVVRELAYTLLNRLVGLKAMESRKLLYLPPPLNPGASPERTEVITTVPGQAYSRFLRDFRAAGGSRYKYGDDAEESLLRDGLTTAFRFVNQEIRVLFDPDHEYSCVWPTHGALANIIRKINEDLEEGVYQAQDFLGWVYQFFNRVEKETVRRDNNGTPRSSYELAILNQFYTPSWVVKVLVDNTLGRLWLQMHPDSSIAPKGPPPLPDERTDAAPVADYLVPRTGEKIRYQRVTELGEVAVYKKAADIALLDPACGTMHFGQYAFGLFHQMYLDEIVNAGKDGWPATPSVANPKEIPAAILENNLFGIDIDPRAIQIASLSLMLTAKEAALRQGFSPLDVHLRRSNLVVANAVDLGEEKLKTLVDKIGGRNGSAGLRERLFKTLWENLGNIGELGSLVQVRESVAQVLDDWVDARAREKGLTKFVRRVVKQGEFGFAEKMDRKKAKQLELERQVLENEAIKLQEELLAGLEAAAAKATDDPADRLFAEDTARGLKFLQMLSRQYDVVVMNPPYGGFVPKVKDFVKTAYPLTYNDIYAAFIDRATQLTAPRGYVGALVSRTFIAQVTAEKLRTHILLKRNPLIFVLDLGQGILDDAAVEAGALVIRGDPQ